MRLDGSLEFGMTHSQLTWLLNRHLGVAATLSHADELIGQVGDLLFDYQTKAEGGRPKGDYRGKG